MKKRIFAIGLCLMMIFASVNAFALNEIKTESKILFDEDFEGYTLDGAISTIMGSNGTAASAATAISAANDLSEESQNKTGFANVKSGAKLGIIFKDGATVNSGKLILEFDGKLVAGNVWFSLLYSGGLGTRAKWFAGSDTASLCTITQTATTPGSSVSGYQKFYDAGSQALAFNQTGWSHYKFVVDMDNNSVTAYMDDKVSTTVTDYAYISGKTIAGIGLYNASQGSRYIDNLKIYVPASGYNAVLHSDDMEGYTVGEPIANKRTKDEGAIYDYWSSLATSFEASFSAVKKGDALCPDGSTGEIKTTTPEDPDNIVAKVGDRTAVQYNLPYEISDGVLCVSADMLAGNGGFGIGIRQKGDSGISAKCPLWLHRNAVRVYYLTSNELSTYSMGNDTSRNYFGSSTTMYQRYQWLNAKLYINAKTGDCWVDINGNVSAPQNIYYIGTQNTTAQTSNAPITGIAFYNTRTSTVKDLDAYIDNVSISCASEGNSVIKTVNGVDKLQLTFKDNIDKDTVGTSNVKVSKDSQPVEYKSLTVIDNNLVIEFADALSIGDTYTVSVDDSIKYTDGYPIISGDYDIEIAETAFEAVSAITDKNYTSGSNVSASFTVTSTEHKAKKLLYIVAAYKDGRLVGANCAEYAVPVTLHGTTAAQKVSFTLQSDADTIRAFALADNLAPCASKAETKASEQ